MAELTYETILHRLQNDPCLAYLGQTFACLDGEFADSGQIIRANGALPVEGRHYTLTEIRYTRSGFVGNFKELPPRRERPELPTRQTPGRCGGV